MGQPTLDFNGTIGQRSTGLGSPDTLEGDLLDLARMFDPGSTLKSGQPGGIGTENLRSGTIPNVFETAATPIDQIGDMVSDPGLDYGGGRVEGQPYPFAGTGTVLRLLSFLSRTVRQITGMTNWHTPPLKSIIELLALVSPDTNVAAHRLANPMDHPTESVTDAHLVTAPVKMTEGSDTFASGWTTKTVTNEFITAATKVAVSPDLTNKLGWWEVVAAAGSFTITSDTTETSNIEFDWWGTKH